ncbi:MAG: hypothetical protein ACOH5I_23330 [Oligoflexus sp.]
MNNTKKKILAQTTIFHRLFGLIFVAGGAIFLFMANTIFEGSSGDSQFDQMAFAIQIFQSIIGILIVSVGLFVFLAKRELIYDETTVEYRTTLLGRSWSRVVDRSLMRDLGPHAFFGARSRHRKPFL